MVSVSVGVHGPAADVANLPVGVFADNVTVRGVRAMSFTPAVSSCTVSGPAGAPGATVTGAVAKTGVVGDQAAKPRQPPAKDDPSTTAVHHVGAHAPEPGSALGAAESR